MISKTLDWGTFPKYRVGINYELYLYPLSLECFYLGTLPYTNNP
jgi:hypothetical protein